MSESQSSNSLERLIQAARRKVIEAWAPKNPFRPSRDPLRVGNDSSSRTTALEPESGSSTEREPEHESPVSF